MRSRSTAFILGVGAWTAVTLAGSIILIFHLPLEEISRQIRPHVSDFAIILLMAPLAFFVIPTTGGGLWGLGMGRLMQSPTKPLMKTGALSWGGTVLWVGLALYFSQYLIDDVEKVAGSLPHYVHFIFTLVFVPGVGIAALLNTRKMAAKLGFADLKAEVGYKSGLAAALAFLAVSMLLLFGVNWEVGRPGYFAGFRYSMISIMHVCNFAAGLSGGVTMGWLLAQNRVVEPALLVQKTNDPYHAR